MNERGWLLGVGVAPWDQREDSSGHKSISRKAVMKIIMMRVIYIDVFYLHDCELS